VFFKDVEEKNEKQIHSFAECFREMPRTNTCLQFVLYMVASGDHSKNIDSSATSYDLTFDSCISMENTNCIYI